MNQYGKLPDRFWNRVEKDANGGCWLWRGTQNNYGYGTLRIEGRAEKAHRYSWELHNGAIPEGLWVLHTCDVRDCVNPAHLFLGTSAENTQDKVRKGRQHFPRGEKHGFARLTEDKVREIRTLYADGLTQGAIGEMFGVGQRAISQVVTRNNWKHVE